MRLASGANGAIAPLPIHENSGAKHETEDIGA
jgi:hypothetical protein